ncbi:MAG: hypothetical protein HUU55_20215 [Myxococcales bacterium]|nr:hypothetical protein [Myxococcales bacterium]
MISSMSSRLLKWATVAGLACLVVTTACKKDEPAPEAPPSSAGVATTPGTPTQAPAEVPGSGAKPAEANPAEQKPDTAVPKVEQPATAAGGAAATDGRALRVDAPDNIIFYGAAKSFDELANKVSEIVSKVQPVPGLAKVFEDGFQREFGFTNLDWLARDKPIVLSGWNPKEIADGAILIVPTKGKDAFVSALPETKQADADGNQFKFGNGTKDYFANLIDDNAVITVDAGIYAKAKTFIEEKLNTYSPGNTIELTIEVGHLTTIFKDEIAQSRTQMEADFGGDGSMPPGVAAILKEEIAMLYSFLESVDTLAVVARSQGEHVFLGFDTVAKPGTGVVTFVESLKGRSLELGEKIPAMTYLAFVGNYDIGKFSDSGWMKLGIEALTEALKLTADDKERLASLQREAMALQTGAFMMAVHGTGSKAFAMSGLGNVQDGAKFREKTFELYNLLWNRAVDRLKAEAGGEIPPQIDLSSFEAALRSIGTVTAEMGVTLTLASSDEEGIKTDVVTVTIDWEKFPLAKEEPEIAGVIKALLGDTLQFGLGVSAKQYAMHVGPDAKAAIRAALAAGGTAPAAYTETTRHGVSSTAMLAYISVIDGLKAFSALPQLDSVREAIGKLEAKNGVGISMAAGEGTELRLLLDVPMDHVAAVVRALGNQ